MRKANIAFFCTGMCGANQPIYDHCKECSHALFKMRLGGLSAYYSPMFGCSFYSRGKIFYPPEGSYLWKVANELVDFADRCFKRWGKKQ